MIFVHFSIKLWIFKNKFFIEQRRHSKHISDGEYMYDKISWLWSYFSNFSTLLQACHAGTSDFCSALAAIVGPVQNIFSSHLTLFQFLCPHRPASRAGSRAGSPVSGEDHCVPTSPHHCKLNTKLNENFSNTAAFPETEVPCLYDVHLFKNPYKAREYHKKYSYIVFVLLFNFILRAGRFMKRYQ